MFLRASVQNVQTVQTLTQQIVRNVETKKKVVNTKNVTNPSVQYARMINLLDVMNVSRMNAMAMDVLLATAVFHRYLDVCNAKS